MKLYKYAVGAMGTNCYLLVDEATREAIIVDPGDNTPDRILEAVKSKNCRVTAILLTHAHFDHIMSLNEIRAATAAPLLLHEAEAAILHDNEKNLFARFSHRAPTFAPADRLLTDGDTVTAGRSVLTVCHTPGHTPGSICLFDEEAGTILTGDTLFREAIGRYDFPDGDYHTLIASLAKLVKVCGDRDYKLCPGHGTSTHLSYELEHNLYLN